MSKARKRRREARRAAAADAAAATSAADAAGPPPARRRRRPPSSGVRDFDAAIAAPASVGGDEEGAGGADGVSARLFDLANSAAVRFRVNHTEVTVQQDARVEGTGGVVWETSYALALHLAPDVRPGTAVLELGAGCGLCGIALAAVGARVVVTEQDSALAALARNRGPYDMVLRIGGGLALGICHLQADHPRTAHARPPARPPYMLGTDVVFARRLVDPLLRTIAELCTAAEPATVAW
eukprot:gene18896-59638_t